MELWIGANLKCFVAVSPRTFLQYLVLYLLLLQLEEMTTACLEQYVL